MTRKELSEYIESGVNQLTPATEYGRGRISEFNSIRNHSYPAVWQETADETGVDAEINSILLPIDSHHVKLHICKRDKQDSKPTQYEEIIDEADGIAQKLVFALNQVVTGYKQLRIESNSRKPFIKLHADCLTGVLLEFDIIAPDTTNNC